MAKLKYTIIKTDEQYYEYCNIHQEIVMSGQEGEREDELELLYFLIDKYDKETFAEKDFDPIEILKDLMENNGLKAKDLTELLGLSKGTVSKILNYQKGLSKRSIRILADRFKMRQDAFNRPYPLQTKLSDSNNESAA